MLYQAMATIKSVENGLQSYVTGWWESSEKACDELGGLMYGKMPFGAFQMTVKIKTDKVCWQI